MSNQEVFDKVVNIPDNVYSSEEKEYFVFKTIDLKAGIIVD